MASMLSPHGQGKGPWILFHVVSGPWTSFVAALDKGQCRKAVCRRYKYTNHKKTLSFQIANPESAAFAEGPQIIWIDAKKNDYIRTSTIEGTKKNEFFRS